ncbi:MAG TPA: HAD-IA family hydrolase [Syntrophorhabdales bacterium]|nr:HAD-IA family hydrolase [Syntrophorhabdales bacterium]
MSLQLILLDLDGTLVDSAADIANAFNYAIGLHGVPPVSRPEIEAMLGEGMVLIMKKFDEWKELGVDPATIRKHFREYYLEHIAVYSAPYPGVEDTLQRLKDFKKAVVSNKLEVFTMKTLKQLRLLHYFDLVVGGDSGPEKKPSPQAILSVISKLGVPADETLMVGDTAYDIEAGRGAGVKTVAATYGYGSPGFADKADFTMDTFPELIDIVTSLW